MSNLMVIIAALMGVQGVFFLVGGIVLRRDASEGSRAYSRVVRGMTKLRALRPEALGDRELMRDFVWARRHAKSAHFFGFGLGSCLAYGLLLLAAQKLRITLDSPPGVFPAVFYVEELLLLCGGVLGAVLFVRRAEKSHDGHTMPLG